MVTKLERKHLEEIVSIHSVSFKDFFLTSLGGHFLHLFYSEFLWHPSAIAYVFIENNLVKGFIVGSLNTSTFYKSILLRHCFYYALLTLPALIKKPKIFLRLIKALRYPQKYKNEKPSISVSILSIAVLPEEQGKGIGKKLINTFINACRNCNAKEISLSTDNKNNQLTKNFYESVGFNLNKTYVTSEKRSMNFYKKDL